MKRLTQVLDRANLETRFKACVQAKTKALNDGDMCSVLAMEKTIDEVLDQWNARQ